MRTPHRLAAKLVVAKEGQVTTGSRPGHSVAFRSLGRAKSDPRRKLYETVPNTFLDD